MQKATENCIKANNLKRLKRAFKKYVDILNKNELEKRNHYLLQMYQSILNAAKTQNLITDICNIQQEIYEDLYLNLDNNSDSNILKVVNENLNYIVYCYNNNFQIDYNKLNKK